MLAHGALLLIVIGLFVEAQFGSTSYFVNGVRYSIPYKYEFSRNVRLPWLENVKGLEPEPEQSIWLMLPAEELARDIKGYSELFHGYSSEVPASLVVNILGGKEAHEFSDDLKHRWEQIDSLGHEGGRREADPTGWERVIWSEGEKGSPAEGHLSFYLISTSHKPMTSNWLPPSCLASPDINMHEIYNCNFTIMGKGRTFTFRLSRENLDLAARIPAYIGVRLDKWR